MRLSRKIAILACLALVSIAPYTASAQNWVIVLLDPPLFGFNDSTLRISDITGEQTTLGNDRLLCMQSALLILDQHLDINTPIRIDTQFLSFGGDAESAILAGAFPNNAFHDFAQTPMASTWFTVAQANQLAGLDLDPDVQRFVPNVSTNDMTIDFNIDIDEDCADCALGPITWYYGIDGKPPEDKIDFLSTVLHEVLHGIGFLPLLDIETGALLADLQDIFTVQLRRASNPAIDYVDMTNEERAEANISGEVVWKGDAIVAAEGAPHPMYAPDSIEVGSSLSHWAITSNPSERNLLMEPFKSEALTNLTNEREALEDIFWPLLPVGAAVDPNNVFVDFSFIGFEIGTPISPFNTALEALAVANPGANIFFAAGTTPETGTFSKASIWQSTGGTVSLGVP